MTSSISPRQSHPSVITSASPYLSFNFCKRSINSLIFIIVIPLGLLNFMNGKLSGS